MRAQLSMDAWISMGCLSVAPFVRGPVEPLSAQPQSVTHPRLLRAEDFPIPGYMHFNQGATGHLYASILSVSGMRATSRPQRRPLSESLRFSGKSIRPFPSVTHQDSLSFQ